MDGWMDGCVSRETERPHALLAPPPPHRFEEVMGHPRACYEPYFVEETEVEGRGSQPLSLQPRTRPSQSRLPGPGSACAASTPQPGRPLAGPHGAPPPRLRCRPVPGVPLPPPPSRPARQETAQGRLGIGHREEFRLEDRGALVSGCDGPAGVRQDVSGRAAVCGRRGAPSAASASANDSKIERLLKARQSPYESSD